MRLRLFLRKPVFAIFLLLLVIAGVAALFLLRREKPTKLESTHPPSYYLELREENKDTFPGFLALFSAEPLAEPFWYHEGKIGIDPGLAEAISKREASERYGLLEHPPRLNLSKPLLFVRQDIVFSGVGRDWGTSRFAIFEKFPARVSLDPYPEESQEIRLPLLNALERLGKVRLLGPTLEIEKGPKEGETPAKLQVQYQERSYELKPGEELPLGEMSKRFRVLQAFTARIPLGAVQPDKTKTETQDWGEINFSTTLGVRLEKPAPASIGSTPEEKAQAKR